MARVADGSLAPADYFLAAGDFLPAGMVISSYLACPIELGDSCAATLDDYLRSMTEHCAETPIITSVVEGPFGPAGAGTCLWRPTADQIDDAEQVVRDALVVVVADTTQGDMTESQLAAIAAQSYAEFEAEHPLENPQRSNVDGADTVRHALEPLNDNGFTCNRTWFADPVDDSDRPAAWRTSRIGCSTGCAPGSRHRNRSRPAWASAARSARADSSSHGASPAGADQPEAYGIGGPRRRLDAPSTAPTIASTNPAMNARPPAKIRTMPTTMFGGPPEATIRSSPLLDEPSHRTVTWPASTST